MIVASGEKTMSLGLAKLADAPVPSAYADVPEPTKVVTTPVATTILRILSSPEPVQATYLRGAQDHESCTCLHEIARGGSACGRSRAGGQRTRLRRRET